MAASAATGLACLLNPYGIHGAIYPLELAGTMSNPIFSRSIAELTPIPLFIQKAGLANLPLLLHLATMVLGALSFLLPDLLARLGPTARASDPSRGGGRTGAERRATQPQELGGRNGSRLAQKREEEGEAAVPLAEPDGTWRISPFRLLLYAAFSFLSLQATRNSHQFAAVVGTVTAWNFAEWASARRNRRGPRDRRLSPPAACGRAWSP